MKVFKNRNFGFSLIETTMAITIVALGLTPLFITQGRVTQDISMMYSSWQAVVILKNEQCDVMRTTVFGAQQAPVLPKKTIDGVDVEFKLKNSNEKSSLKTVKNMELLQATADWESFGRPSSFTLLSTVVIPEKKSEEKGV